MFTIKLMMARRDDHCEDYNTLFSTRLVEASEVSIHCLRAGELFEVATPTAAFYIAPRDKPYPSGFAAEIDFYYAAFIENAAGKTTERVTF